MKKEVLLGNFIYKNKILSYLEFIHNKYNISYDGLFIYEIDSNSKEYLVTFKIDTTKRQEYKDIKGTHILHFKRGVLFSINALNSLINHLSQTTENNHDYVLNWEEYTNKLILNINNKLDIKDIVKIDDKNLLFK